MGMNHCVLFSTISALAYSGYIYSSMNCASIFTQFVFLSVSIVHVLFAVYFLIKEAQMN
ncbi:hypothetical protein bthur0002_62230 [Bacillus thuringiensis Bt407]|nr:hypothetical protein bthur0002_62230 [Bacillus thuringiensis Bt407]